MAQQGWGPWGRADVLARRLLDCHAKLAGPGGLHSRTRAALLALLARLRRDRAPQDPGSLLPTSQVRGLVHSRHQGG